MRNTRRKIEIFGVLLLCGILLGPLGTALISTKAATASLPLVSSPTGNKGVNGKGIVYENSKTYYMGPSAYGRVQTTGEFEWVGFGEMVLWMDLTDIDRHNNIAVYIDGDFKFYVNPSTDDRQWVGYILRHELTYTGYHTLEIRSHYTGDWVNIYKIQITERRSEVFYENYNTYYFGPSSYDRIQTTPTFYFDGYGPAVVVIKLVDTDRWNNLYVEIDGGRKYYNPTLDGVLQKSGYWTLAHVFDLGLQGGSTPGEQVARHSLKVGITYTGDWVNVYAIQVYEARYTLVTGETDFKLQSDVTTGTYSSGGGRDTENWIFDLGGITPVDNLGRTRRTNDNPWLFGLSASMTHNYDDYMVIPGYPPSYISTTYFYEHAIKSVKLTFKTWAAQGDLRPAVGGYEYGIRTTTFDPQDNPAQDIVMELMYIGLDTAASAMQIPLSPSSILKLLDQNTPGAYLTHGEAGYEPWVKVAPTPSQSSSDDWHNLGLKVQLRPTIPDGAQSHGLWRLRVRWDIELCLRTTIITILASYYDSQIETFTFYTDYFFEVYL